MAFNKSSLSAYSVSDQAVDVGDSIRYEFNRVHPGCSIKHSPGSAAVILAGAGLYSGTFSANFTADANGAATFQLYRNGVLVPGAEATHQATANVPIAIAFPILELVRPSCIAVDNTAVLQVQVSAAGTINTAQINIVKEA